MITMNIAILDRTVMFSPRQLDEVGRQLDAETFSTPRGRQKSLFCENERQGLIVRLDRYA